MQGFNLFFFSLFSLFELYVVPCWRRIRIRIRMIIEDKEDGGG